MKNIKRFLKFCKNNKKQIFDEIFVYTILAFAVIGIYNVEVYLGKLIF